MGDKSAIEWTDATWNPVTGCTKVSQGCKNCYAERVFARVYPKKKFGTGIWCHPERLDQPLRWKKPRRIFVNSMSDLFHEAVPFGFVMRCLQVMAHTPYHTYQILTKRPERMKKFFDQWGDLSGEDFEPKLVRGPEATRKAHPSGRGQLFAEMLDAMGTPPDGCAYPTFDWMEGMIGWPKKFRNIHLGVSVEDQETADERIPLLLQTPAAVRFISAEPLLGAINIKPWLPNKSLRDAFATSIPLAVDVYDRKARIDWVIAGGESGPRARPMHPDWVRSLRDQCVAAGVPFFFKQWGEWAPVCAQYPQTQSEHDQAEEASLCGDICISNDGYIWPENHQPSCNGRPWLMDRIGKKAAGAMLDGREWREFPSDNPKSKI